MANFHSSAGKARTKKISISDSKQIYETDKLELYRAFMTGYVKRINEGSFNVSIGGVRIGSAKYSRLAQINLSSRIITFSRFAVENVPERGRRYLVLHELAHVKEASHNKRFWQLVGKYEPDYRQIGKSLEVAFKENVKNEGKKESLLWTEKNLLSVEEDASRLVVEQELLPTYADEDNTQSLYDCEIEQFLDWTC